MFMEDADFSRNLAPTRLLSLRKTQKIFPKIWHLSDSYVEGTSRSFLRKISTYAMSYMKIHKKYQPGMLAPEQLIFYKLINVQVFYAVTIFIFTSLLY